LVRDNDDVDFGAPVRDRTPGGRSRRCSGVPGQMSKSRGYGPHDERDLFAARLRSAGVSVQVAGERVVVADADDKCGRGAAVGRRGDAAEALLGEQVPRDDAGGSLRGSISVISRRTACSNSLSENAAANVGTSRSRTLAA